jgi:hypothetical protein
MGPGHRIAAQGMVEFRRIRRVARSQGQSRESHQGKSTHFENTPDSKSSVDRHIPPSDRKTPAKIMQCSRVINDTAEIRPVAGGGDPAYDGAL